MTHVLLAAALALSPAQRARIDAIVASVMRERHVAGLSLGVARGGRTLYLRGYGLRNVGERQPADGFTIYRAGSIAKQFTAALVMQDVARGRIGIDRALNAYLPGISADFGRITVAQLLGQTSGIAGSALAFEPGTGWSYDNANYLLLGDLLNRVTGTRYPDLLAERITQPLAMVSTGCAPSPFATNVAQGYDWRDGRRMPADAFDERRACAAYGLVSNVPDLLVWLEALRSARVLSRESVATMTTSGKLANGTPTHYGYGFFLTDWFGYAVAEHPGYVEGFSGQVALVLNDGLAVALLTNAGTLDLTPLSESILAIVEPPLDRNLSATLSLPAQNENARVTSGLKTLLASTRYAGFGTLASVEFVERSMAGGIAYDKYRVTFSNGRWWAIVAYRSDDAIVSVSLMPVE